MRIAVWHNLPSGGGKRALHDHLRGLRARGHEMEIWSPPTADASYLPLTEFGREHVVDLAWPAQDWRERLRLRTPQETQLAAIDAHARQCAEEIGRGRFDLLFANSCQFLAATSIGRFTPLPSALYLQEPNRRFYEAQPNLLWAAPEASRGLKHWARAREDRYWISGMRVQVREEARNARAFERILVNSYFSRESVLRAYGVESEVCYLGVDLNRFCDRGLTREPFVVGLGAFTASKGVELAVRAIALMPAPRPPLVWIGNHADEPYLARIVALAKALDVNFQPRRRIPDEEILDLLNGAFAMIYAPRLEPFGLAPIEAAACGLPVVAAAEGGVRETVVNEVTGLVAAPKPRALAEALDRLRHDPALYSRLRTGARRNAEALWSQDAATDRLERQLIEVAEGRSEARAPASEQRQERGL